MSVVEVSADYGGRLLTLQTGKLAKQTDASVLARYGDTIVLVTVVASKTVKEDQDFFPLTVDYQEKYYAAGRIPGGFFKREAKPSEKATLSARLIDRPLRPLFPEDFLCETHVVATVLSTDGVNDADIVASIAASAALHISDIPWNGPIGACRVGHLNGQLGLNLSPEDQAESKMDLLVSGVGSGVIMVEGGAKEISEKELMDAIDFAHEQMQPILDLQEQLRQKVGKAKREYPRPLRNEDLKSQMRSFLWDGFGKAFAIREKLPRYEALKQLETTAADKFLSEDADSTQKKLVKLYLEEIKAAYAREKTLENKARIDGRKYSDIRPISCEIGLLPRVHGSSVFTRGETQVLAAVTLGTSDDEQKIDSISGTYQKTFMLHYNFPPFSVGEARAMRAPGRREIGHGHLAERAIANLMPTKEEFPYTVRVVAEVLESNGSSSMATVCSTSMALMEAGVPLPKPVAGVAMGLIKEGNSVAVLSDILGDEDHLGDMDFKVCGTSEGITAFQMDLKIGGVDRLIMEQALEQAREGRLHVLDKMAGTIERAREGFSPFAPRIHTIKIKPDKVREVIGSGGKVIRGIIEQTGVKIDIEDDGSIHIASSDETAAQKAIGLINQIVEEPEIGRIYEGRVTRIAEFGAFVEIIPGTDGLVHISELEHHRVRRVEDVVQQGDIIRVKCLDVDGQGKIRLSRRALLPAEGGNGQEATEAPETAAPADEEHESAEETIGNRRPEGAAPRRESRPSFYRDEERPERGERSSRERSDRGDRERGRGDRDRGNDRGERSDRGDRRPSFGGRGGERHDRGDRRPRGGHGSGGGGMDRGMRSAGGRPQRGESRGMGGRDRGGRSDSDRDRGDRGGERDRGARGSQWDRGEREQRYDEPAWEDRYESRHRRRDEED